MNQLTNIQTMSSREIADLANKNHRDIMRAIRTMEPAWVRVTGRKFALSAYKDATGRTLPMYQLSKTECLYIATKFNDEARARLVIRWEELEQAAQRTTLL
ncbi:phage regulatory protein/antirepressor Ant, partial [Dysgonomonas sp. 521]|uniref:Rha family transcriptional regulator n=1 Tax=Dysgonomonas sp. 521 TaxID=2302932 RepID=UPI0013D16AB9